MARPKSKLPAKYTDNQQVRKPHKSYKDVDQKLVESLAMIHCTVSEIARICDVSPDTIDRHFAQILEKGYDEGKRSLRRLQWREAEKGNIMMLIWLGKQWLGQRDKQPDEAPQTIINVQVNEQP